MRLSVVGCWLLVGSLLAGVSGQAQTTEATMLLPQMPLHGPWVQLAPLVKQDSGHGMLVLDF